MIYIIGAGAIGKALAVFLKLHQKEVLLIRGSEELDSPTLENILVELPDKTVQAEIEVSSFKLIEELDGTVLLTNKAHGNERVAGLLKDKVKDSPIVILQNGLDVELPFIQAGMKQIYRCVLFATSQYLEASRLKFRPVDSSPIGIIQGSTENVQKVVSTIQNEFFPFRFEADIEPIIWTKTSINCVFNSICPLLEIDNGIFYRDENAMKLASRIIHECIEIAHSYNIDINQNTVMERLLQISKSSDGQLISTYQDILNGRKTEIDYLNVAIEKRAEKIGKSDMVKITALLGQLIKTKSELKKGNLE